MVLPDSNRVPRVPLYSGASQVLIRFRLRGYHPLWPAFPGRSTTLKRYLTTPAGVIVWSYNPIRTTPAGLHTYRLGSSAFARHY